MTYTREYRQSVIRCVNLADEIAGRQMCRESERADLRRLNAEMLRARITHLDAESKERALWAVGNLEP